MEKVIEELQKIEERLRQIRKEAISGGTIKIMGQSGDFRTEFQDELEEAYIAVNNALCVVSKYFDNEDESPSDYEIMARQHKLTWRDV